jgi:Glycosyltransferase family 87
MSLRSPLGATPDSGSFDLRTGQGRAATSNARLGQIGLAGLIATGLVISLAAANTDSLLPESVRPVPAWLAGPFGATGLGLGVLPLLLVLSMMFVSYALAARAADRLSGRAVLMTIAALHALVLLAPPLLSTDVFSYQAYARMGSLYGANPYLQGPHAIALDPIYPFIGAKWVTTPSAYGPLFTSISYVLAPLSIAASVLAYKAMAAVSSLALVAIVWNAARLRGLNPVRAAALVGLNPLLVVYGVGGGHNDLLMLVAMVGGIYLLLQHRERAGGASMILGAAIKLTAGLFLPFAVAGAGGPRRRQRRSDVLAGAAVAAAAVAGLGFAMFGSGQLHVLSNVQQGQSEGDWHSIPGLLSTRLGLPQVGHVTGVLLAVAFVVCFAWLIRRVWRGELDWIDGAAWAAVALLVTASAMLPWYVDWLLPLAALASDRRLGRTAVLLTGVVLGIEMLGYIPHGVGS